MVKSIKFGAENRGVKAAHKGFMALYLAAITVSLGQSVLLSFIPLLLDITTLSIEQVGFVFAVGAFAFLPGTPFWASLSDKINRKRVLIYVLGGVVISNCLFFLVVMWARNLTSEWIFLGLVASRVVYGFFASGITPSVQAWIADQTPDEYRLREMTKISSALNIGRVIGPIVVLITINIYSLLPLICLSVYSAVALWFLVRSRAPVTKSEPGNKLWFPLGKSGAYVLLAILTMILLGVVQCILGPLLQSRLYLSAETSSQTVAILLVLSAMFALATHRWMIKKLQDPWSGQFPAAACLFFLGSIGLFIADALYLFIGSIACYSIGIALITPSYTTAITLISSAPQGRVAAVTSVAHITGFGIGVLLGGWVYSLEAYYAVSLLLGLSVAIILLALNVPKNITETIID